MAVDPDEVTERMTPGNLITLTWSSEAPFVLPGRTAIVGATSTDFDEVEATMAGAARRRRRRRRRCRQPRRRRGGGPEADDGSMNRRRFLVGGGIVAAGAVGAVLLSSVRSDSGAAARQRPTAASGSAGAGLGDGADELNVINWTEYIDLTEDGEVGSDRPLPGRDRDLGQLLGDLERQQRGVRQGVRRLPGGRQPDAVGHRRADLLAGGPAQVETAGWRRSRTTSSRTT